MFKLLQQFHTRYQKNKNKSITNNIANEETTKEITFTSLRVKIMVSTLLEPSASSHLYEIRRLTTALADHIPNLRFAKWKDTKPTTEGRALFDQIPNHPENAEQFIYGYHAEVNQPKGYYRLHLLHPSNMDSDAFQYVFDEINIPRKQSVSYAPANVLNPTVIGFLKGSTEAMMNSIDFHEIIKQSELNFGFEWKFIQTGTAGKFNRNQKAIFVETNTIDASGMKNFLTSFFKKNNPIFGVNLSFQPLSRYGTNAQMNQIRQYAPIQSKLISALLDFDVEIGNFEKIALKKEKEDSLIKTPLIEALLNLQSVTQKKSIKKGEDFHFEGKVFYSAITNAATKITTFQFFDYNEKEATGILKGLPFFLRDHFHIEDKNIRLFCRSTHIAEAKNGSWNSSTRTFLSQEEITELQLIENLDIITNAHIVTTAKYIDPAHQRMMTGQNPDDISDTTDLHNNKDDTSSITNNTGSTTTSKAQKFATSVRKEMLREIHLQRMKSEQRIYELEQKLKAATMKGTTDIDSTEDPYEEDTPQFDDEDTLDSNAPPPNSNYTQAEDNNYSDDDTQATDNTNEAKAKENVDSEEESQADQSINKRETVIHYEDEDSSSTEMQKDSELPEEVHNNQQNESDEDDEETDYKYSSSQEEETEKEDQTTYEAFTNNTATQTKKQHNLQDTIEGTHTDNDSDDTIHANQEQSTLKTPISKRVPDSPKSPQKRKKDMSPRATAPQKKTVVQDKDDMSL